MKRSYFRRSHLAPLNTLYYSLLNFSEGEITQATWLPRWKHLRVWQRRRCWARSKQQGETPRIVHQTRYSFRCEELIFLLDVLKELRLAAISNWLPDRNPIKATHRQITRSTSDKRFGIRNRHETNFQQTNDARTKIVVSLLATHPSFFAALNFKTLGRIRFYSIQRLSSTNVSDGQVGLASTILLYRFDSWWWEKGCGLWGENCSSCFQGLTLLSTVKVITCLTSRQRISRSRPNGIQKRKASCLVTGDHGNKWLYGKPL